MRALALVALAAAVALPATAMAQTSAPMPKPTNAIKNTQSGIHKAAQKQSHAEKMTKTGKNKVGVGGAHPDAEVPNNPGETSNKPGAGPGYAGTAPKAANPAPQGTIAPGLHNNGNT